MVIFDWIGQILWHLFGFAIAGGILAFIYKRHAVNWEGLAEVYYRPWTPPLEKKMFQHLVLYGNGFPAKTYNGLLTVGLYKDGISLAFPPFFAFFHEPLFIPYSHISGSKQVWYVNSKSAEIRLRDAPGFRLIMPQDQFEWISDAAAGRISYSPVRLPSRDWPYVTYALAILSGVIALATAFLALFVFQAQLPL